MLTTHAGSFIVMALTMPLVFWFLIALAPLPLLFSHVSWMWQQEAYHYLPALGLAMGLLFAIRWDRVVRLPGSYAAWGLLVFSFGVVLPIATWSYSPWLGTFAFVLSLGAFLLSQRGMSDAKGTPFQLWPLAWLMLTLPLQLDQSLTTSLQRQASRLSSYLLDLLGVPHMLLGNVLELASGRLFVEEACSGVQSLYTLVFCAVLIVVVLGRALSLLPLYIALAVLWAGLMNVARIVSIAAVRYWYGWDWSHGWQHSAIGYLSLAVAVLLLLSSDRLIRVAFFPAKPEGSKSKRTNPMVRAWNYLFWPEPSSNHVPQSQPVSRLRAVVPAMMALAIAVCLWQSVRTVQAVSLSYADQPVAQDRQEPFFAAPNSIPTTAVKNFTQVSYEHVRGSIDMPMGENGDVWRGIVAGVPVTIALTQPYPTWHDLALCYRGIGWQLNDRQNVIASDGDGQDWGYASSRLLSDHGTYAYVWFCGFDEHGHYVESADRSLLSRLRSRANGDRPAAHGRIAMVQLVVEADSSLPPDVLDALAQAFLDSRKFLVSMVDRKSQK